MGVYRSKTAVASPANRSMVPIRCPIMGTSHDSATVSPRIIRAISPYFARDFLSSKSPPLIDYRVVIGYDDIDYDHGVSMDFIVKKEIRVC